MSESGFYRVFSTSNGAYFKYQIRNKLVSKEITRRDILELKKAVEEAGFLWGIIDIDKAQLNSQKYKLKVLEGRYGLHIKGEDL